MPAQSKTWKRGISLSSILHKRSFHNRGPEGSEVGGLQCDYDVCETCYQALNLQYRIEYEIERLEDQRKHLRLKLQDTQQAGETQRWEEHEKTVALLQNHLSDILNTLHNNKVQNPQSQTELACPYCKAVQTDSKWMETFPAKRNCNECKRMYTQFTAPEFFPMTRKDRPIVPRQIKYLELHGLVLKPIGNEDHAGACRYNYICDTCMKRDVNSYLPAILARIPTGEAKLIVDHYKYLKANRIEHDGDFGPLVKAVYTGLVSMYGW